MGGFGEKSCGTGDERVRLPDAVLRALALFGTCSPGHTEACVSTVCIHFLLFVLCCSSQCEARMSGCLQQSDVSPPSTVPLLGGRG